MGNEKRAGSGKQVKIQQVDDLQSAIHEMAFGTVCGGRATSRWFIENGRHHAQLIARFLTAQYEK